MSNKNFKVADKNDWSVFRTRLRSCMENNGLNMSSLANLSDLGIATISRYFQGRVPDLLAIWRLADTFGVSIDWLCGRVPSKFENLTDEQRELLDKYSQASPADKNIINLFLSKYE